MKNLYLLFLLSSSAFAQDYLPFEPGAAKRFYESLNPVNNGHFYYDISNVVSNDTLYLGQYLMENQAAQIDVSGTICEGWGGGPSNLVDSTWLGRNFHFDITNRILTHRNQQESELNFDFGLPLGDSALIYQDASDSYYLVHDTDDQQVILTYTDSVKNFRVVHYDSFGTAVNSPLHNAVIRLGKDIGLISFMNCYKFPSEETAMELMGQLEPRIGDYQMTYDMAFPWEVGDVVQYRGYTPLMIPANYISLLEYTVINKVITADSVFIYLDSTEQILYPFDTATTQITLPSSYYNIRYQSPIKFKKNDCIFKVPMLFVPSIGYERYYADSANFCGYFDQETQNGTYTNFCDSCSCLPPADGFGQTFERKFYTAGHGWTHRSGGYYGPPQGYPTADLLYSNLSINGNIPCGTAITFGFEELELRAQIVPNPSEGKVVISTFSIPREIQLFNASGQLLTRWTELSLENHLNIQDFSPGIYLLKIEFEEGVISKKIVLR